MRRYVDRQPLAPEITLLAGDKPGTAGDDTVNAIPSSLALKPDGTLAALVQHTGECFQSYLMEVPPGGGPSDFQSLGSIFCGLPISGGLEASLAMGKDGSLVATWSDYDAQAPSLFQHDAVLGWTLRPGFRSELSTVGLDGRRRDPSTPNAIRRSFNFSPPKGTGWSMR